MSETSSGKKIGLYPRFTDTKVYVDIYTTSDNKTLDLFYTAPSHVYQPRTMSYNTNLEDDLFTSRLGVLYDFMYDPRGGQNFYMSRMIADDGLLSSLDGGYYNLSNVK